MLSSVFHSRPFDSDVVTSCLSEPAGKSTPVQCQCHGGAVCIGAGSRGATGARAPSDFWRGGKGGHHAVRKCTMKFAALTCTR